jgi:hypothetical protein
MVTGYTLIWSMLTQVFSLREANDVIIYSRNTISDDKSTHESVCQPDEASHETYSIPDKKLTEQREVRANDIPPLKYEPIGRDKDCKASNKPCDNALNGCIEPQEPGQHHLLQILFVLGHAVTLRLRFRVRLKRLKLRVAFA